tara:strand:+ start:470 stop:1180 length:711 start_codon:yes stop_codon:yes gene_type:complete
MSDNMTDNSNIINWNGILLRSQEFQGKTPTRFAFLENFFFEDFYNKLYETFPDISMFTKIEEPDKSALRRWWGTKGAGEIINPNERDEQLSPEWNTFYEYLHSDDFFQNIQKFSGLNVNKTKHFAFLNMQKGGFQLPHIHDVGPSTVVLLLYFNENWPDGEPGGTYMSKNEGSDIIFEPYNLDNSCMIFQDGPHAEHGVRYIDTETERKAIQITVEGFSEEKGWSAYERKIEKIEL